jgi:hypothetical protein
MIAACAGISGQLHPAVPAVKTIRILMDLLILQMLPVLCRRYACEALEY